jgi:glucose 1-dehydrogenase
VHQLTTSTSIALATHGIRVNSIGPGSIRTDMFAAVVATPEDRKRVMSRTPLGRPGEVEEVAALAAFLASDESSYITGQTIYIDGGRMPLNYTVPVKQ